MRILLVPDKFKGSLTAEAVISAVSKGVKKSMPKAEIHTILASDGGDGFLDSIKKYSDNKVLQVETVNPLGLEIKADYLFNLEEKSAFIELAKASGLELLKEKERNAMESSTYGTGLLIKDAILNGCTSIYIGLGGSATNDAGLGIAEALGFYFLDSEGNQLSATGSSLSKVSSIHKKSNSISLHGISFFAVNDVDNTLFGPKGSAYTYAKQKGANAEEIRTLDCGLKDFADVVKMQTGKDMAELPGSGAAGGTAYGLKVFFDAEFVSGIDFVLGISKANELLNQYKFDYIITGEGKFDAQTLYGKLIKGVIELGEKHQVTVLAVCGQIDLDQHAIEKMGHLKIVEIKDPSKSLEYTMKNAGMLIEKSIELFFKKK